MGYVRRKCTARLHKMGAVRCRAASLLIHCRHKCDTHSLDAAAVYPARRLIGQSWIVKRTARDVIRGAVFASEVRALPKAFSDDIIVRDLVAR